MAMTMKEKIDQAISKIHEEYAEEVEEAVNQAKETVERVEALMELKLKLKQQYELVRIAKQIVKNEEELLDNIAAQIFCLEGESERLG